MSLLIGDTGKVASGTLKTMNITIATPREVSLGTITLPNTEGATNQVSFTVQESDLPLFSMKPFGVKYLACIITSGKAGAAATTVSYRVFKNGTSITTSNSSQTANQYWTQSHWRWLDVAVGDTLEIRQWANVADANLDYCALIIYPTQLYLSKPDVLLKDINISSTHSLANLTGAGIRATQLSTTSQIGFQIGSITNQSGSMLVNTSTGATVYAVIQHPTLGFMRTNLGDLNGLATTGSSHATNINYQRNTIPSQITFREFLR